MGLLNEIAEKLLKNFLSLKEDDWIEWIAQPNDWQDDCDKFNGCYFIVKQMPKYPQHPRCQCRLKKLQSRYRILPQKQVVIFENLRSMFLTKKKVKAKKNYLKAGDIR